MDICENQTLNNDENPNPNILNEIIAPTPILKLEIEQYSSPEIPELGTGLAISKSNSRFA